jgi:hypothetical protein
MNNHQTCLECGCERLYRYTDTGIFIGRWRKPLPEPTPKRWDFATEANAVVNAADVAALRHRDLSSFRRVVETTNAIVDRHMTSLAVRG